MHRNDCRRPRLPRLAAELAFIAVQHGIQAEILPGEPATLVLHRAGHIAAMLVAENAAEARKLIGLPPAAPQLDAADGLVWELDRRDPGCCQAPEEEDDHAYAC